MKQIPEYVDHIEPILEMDYISNDNIVQVKIDTLILALVWDFQALVAQEISSIPFTIEGVAFLRHTMIHTISKIPSTTFNSMHFKKLFDYIVLNTSPYIDEHAIGRRCPCTTRLIDGQFPDGPVNNFYDEAYPIRGPKSECQCGLGRY